MRVGILGSGLIGGKHGTLFARAGHEVVFSYSHGEQKLKRLAREAQGNARAGTPGEAARDTDAHLLAVHCSRMDNVLHQADDVSVKVIVTCSLPMNNEDSNHVLTHTSSSAEARAKMVPTARIVAAFNTVPSEVLFGAYDAKRKARRSSLVYCGDEDRDKGVAATLIFDVGFDPVDAGLLRIARYAEPFALLVGQLAYGGNGGPELAYWYEWFRTYRRMCRSNRHERSACSSREGMQIWTSSEAVPSPPAKDRPSTLPARFVLTPCFRHPSPHGCSAPVSRSRPAPGLHGTLTRWAKP